MKQDMVNFLIALLLILFALPAASSAREDIFIIPTSTPKTATDQDIIEVLSEIKSLEKKVNVPLVLIPVAKLRDISWNKFAFDASSTYYSWEGELTYLWNFGDGFSSREKIAEHQYKPGNYAASLEVGDSTGLIKEIKFPVEVSFWNIKNMGLKIVVAGIIGTALTFLTLSFFRKR